MVKLKKSIGLFFALVIGLNAMSQKLNVSKLEINYPVPAIPYYHVKADLSLPASSMIEVEMAVNGRTLRYTDLRPEHNLGDLSHPHLTNRPPSGAGLSQDHKLYNTPSVIGWVKWKPGTSYDIKITVRMKKNLKHDKSDVILTHTQKVAAPSASAVFDTAWQKYKSVVLSESAGEERKAEPVEVLLPFYPDEVDDLKREIRVAAFDPVTKTVKEIASQVYDIQEYLVEDDLAPGKDGKVTRDVPVWMPSVSARVAFLADVPARSSRIYLVYYGNKGAMIKNYTTDLRVQGEAPGLRIDNDFFTVGLHPHSGHFDQLTLKSKPEYPLYHRKETNGAIHWNPEVYAPPVPWTHTSDWRPPQNVKSVIGPIISFSDVWGNLREIPQVDASVRYEFYPGKPYFISTTNLRINETVQVIALRNAEIVLKRELITHAAWYDALRDSIVEYDVTNMPELTDVKMLDDVPWISFYNKETGVGFAGIQLGYSNTGLENRSRLLNPFFYITGGPWIYWARALSLPFLSSNMQQMVPALKGNFFHEKWAYLVFETDKTKQPYAPVLNWQKKLTSPLRIQLVEEVDDRVSKTVTELYIEKGKTGWEGRETGRH
ncbi:hypothetical protein [Agriterribacter sp.]|uniref:hypothetical protein n=1 Tax=Agriterribacter sp. TaxID=2821509 RepID=UPI002CE6491E|nr:hypothetical protein [Agriterribacter sp.]HTN08733.1 hypothetical protein [Agriterribacter sp.]